MAEKKVTKKQGKRGRKRGVQEWKQYEKAIRVGFNEVEGCSVDRIKDAKDRFSSTFQETSEIADFIAFKEPTLLFVECKTTKQTHIRYNGDIRPNQWAGLINKHQIGGVYSLFFFWFIGQEDGNFAVPVDELARHRLSGRKTLSMKMVREGELKVIPLNATLKQKYYKYDLSNIFDLAREFGKLEKGVWLREHYE